MTKKTRWNRFALRISGWLGKLSGGAAGYLLAGFWGVPLGIVVGHYADRRLGRGHGAAGTHSRREQQTLFTLTFSVMGHVAKVDGRVSEAEIQAARRVMGRMRLDEEQTRLAIGLFNEGKNADFPLDNMLSAFHRRHRRDSGLARLFLENLLEVAMADGHVQPAKQGVLQHICRRLELHPRVWEKMAQRWRISSAPPSANVQTGAEGLAAAYNILNVSPQAGNDEIKMAYRRLVRMHHPDKLAAQGLPDEAVRISAGKMHEINAAYECVRQARGF
jgi:DnaJ like chaperone protein